MQLHWVTLLCVCVLTGCTQMPGLDKSADTAREVRQECYSDGPLAFSIVLISEQQGSVGSARQGWILIEVKNTSLRPLDLLTGIALGKSEVGRPSQAAVYSRNPYYAGFALASFRCEFIGASGAVEHVVPLAPPDGGTLAPGGRRECWRPIALPTQPGKYTIRVMYEDCEVRHGMLTHNTILDTPVWSGGTCVCELHGVWIR